MSDEELKLAIREAVAELARRRPVAPSADRALAGSELLRALDGGAIDGAPFGALTEDESMDLAEALAQAHRAEREAGLAPRSIVLERAERGWAARLDAHGIRVEAPSAALAARSLRSSLRAA